MTGNMKTQSLDILHSVKSSTWCGFMLRPGDGGAVEQGTV